MWIVERKNYIRAGNWSDQLNPPGKQTANSIRSYYSVSIMQVWLLIGLQSLYTRRQLIIRAPCPACYGVMTLLGSYRVTTEYAADIKQV